MSGASRPGDRSAGPAEAPALRRLLPEPAEVALDGLYAGLTMPTARAERPGWVALDMVSSVDGSATVAGRTVELGGRADTLALTRLRDAADVVLVGAGTVRAEGYGPLAGTAERRRDRVSRGLAPRPRLAVVTASGRLDPSLGAFTDPSFPALVLAAGDADPAALARLEDVAEVHQLGPAPFRGGHVVDYLVGRGLARVVCEGGPRLNASLVEAGRVDEVFVTVAPTLVAGIGPRIVTGELEHRTDLELVEAHEHAGELLLHYRVPPEPGPTGGA